MSAYLNSSWTDLKESRGHESYSHKLFMRYSVLVPDVALFFTAAVLFMFCYTGSSRLVGSIGSIIDLTRYKIYGSIM